MTLISEDPTLLVGFCLLVAVGCFVALRATQNGKCLIWGLLALGAAGAILAVEWFWVTDNERIEAVVYDLQRALLAADVDGLLAHMTPDVQLIQEEGSLPPAATRALIRAAVANSRFEMVRIRGLQTSAGKLTRRGKADFRTLVQGSSQGGMGMAMTGVSDASWSLGFEETEPGVWKVDRITPVSLPHGASLLSRTWGKPAEATTRPFPGPFPFPGPGLRPQPEPDPGPLEKRDRGRFGRFRHPAPSPDRE